MTRALTLYETYSRQEVHDIFSPETRFTPNAGTWGLHGIVPVPSRAGDFVLFVTFGQEQAGHIFDEWISEDGIINWQSQPRQSLADRQIQQFIRHDPARNTIYLFLRTQKVGLYTYLGRLAYHSHDPQRERPVWIQWRLLDWPIPEEVLHRMRLTLKSISDKTTSSPSIQPQMTISPGAIPSANDQTRSPDETSQQPEAEEQPGRTVQFEWRNQIYRYDEQQLHHALRERAQKGFPEDALRVRNWYLPVVGQMVSIKWLFSRLTKASYDDFVTQQARAKIAELGLYAFYQTDAADVHRGWAIDLANPNPVGLPSDHQAFVQAFRQEIRETYRLGTLVFPQTKNHREAHYLLADIGKVIFRENDNQEFELSFEVAMNNIIADHFLENIHPALSQASDQLEYPLYIGKTTTDTCRICTEVFTIDPYILLWDELGIGSSRLSGDYVPQRWDQTFQKAKTVYSLSATGEIFAHLFGGALAEFANCITPFIQSALAPPRKSLQPTEYPLPERKMYRSKFYKAQTIRAITNLILDLAQLGEISLEGISGRDLHDYHVLQLIQSGWAIPTPYALVATPRMLKALPIPNREALREVLHLADWDTQGWAGFDQKAFHLATDQHFPQLSYDYIYTLKTTNFTEDPLWRPVWLVNYLPQEDWDDWEVLNLMHEVPKRREAKLYVHSVIPIQNVYGGLAEAQEAVWKSALYWLMLQLLILSDTETGAVYDPQISVHLSEGWRDGSAARLFLQGEYISELADCLPDLMAPFKWVWVNRSDSASENNQACLGLLRLLLKIEIAELAKDGRLTFTDAFRRQLFENQAKARLHYLHSKEARDKLRETIKEMAG